MKKALPICVICGSKKNKVLRDTLRYGIKRKVLKCSRCALVYLEPVGGASKAYYAGKKYRKRHGPDLKKASSPREIFNAYFSFQKPIIKAIEPIIRPNMKVLDVGCSTGHFLAALKGRVKERVGLELGEAPAAFIKKNLDFKVYSEPIERVKISEGPFDLITALQVLEHIADPINFLKGMARNLKPNGYLYLEIPNVTEALLTVFKIKEYEDFYYREPHLFYYSKKTLKALLKKAGFEGEIKNAPRYNIINSFNWILAKKPQKNFSLGAGDPLLVSDHRVDKSIRKDFNKFVLEADLKYKQLMEKHNLGENLTFLGRKML